MFIPGGTSITDSRLFMLFHNLSVKLLPGMALQAVHKGLMISLPTALLSTNYRTPDQLKFQNLDVISLKKCRI